MKRNIFITGPGGCGKSYLLQQIISKLDEKVYVTGSTGISAINVGGVTLHRMAGLGLGDGSIETLVNKMRKTKRLLNLWRSMKILAIDEIGFLDIEYFEKLSAILQIVRNSPYPFGGIQLILIGDFLQLGPIKKENGYLFQRDIWEKLNLTTVYLCKPKRFMKNIDENDEIFNRVISVLVGDSSEKLIKEEYTYGDHPFFDMLNMVRYGVPDPTVRQFFAERISKTDELGDDLLNPKKSQIIPTVLIATNKEVDSHNRDELNKLNTEEVKFKAIYTSSMVSPIIKMEEMLKSIGLPECVTLKVGAQVMLTRNMFERNLCNGSRGRILSFANGIPVVEFMDGEKVSIASHEWTQKMLVDREEWFSIIHIPLKLAWATTIHKSQGLTLDNVCLDLSTCFSPGHIYVSMTRCRNPENIYIMKYGAGVYKKCAPDIATVEFYKNLESSK